MNLTYENFLAWLRERAADGRVAGFAGDPMQCPIACYLRAHDATATGITVGLRTFRLDHGESVQHFHLAPWAATFVRRVDGGAASGAHIPARVALEVLEGIKP